MEKPERTHVYIGRCPDCEAALTMISVTKGDDPSWVALEVAQAIMRGLVVAVMTDLDFRDQRPQMGECNCKARMLEALPHCAYCGDPIYNHRDAVELSGYMQGSIAIYRLHPDCHRFIERDESGNWAAMDWGTGERPDSPEKAADALIAARAEAIRLGQMELPL